jgi:hypothetical protein
MFVDRVKALRLNGGCPQSIVLTTLSGRDSSIIVAVVVKCRWAPSTLNVTVSGKAVNPSA